MWTLDEHANIHTESARIDYLNLLYLHLGVGSF